MTKTVKLGISAAMVLPLAIAWMLFAKIGSEWIWPLGIVVPLFLVAVLYALGSFRLLRTSRVYRPWPTIYFALGWLSLLLALDSPIHEIGEQLFWVHMTQHEILMLVSAPLIALGEPIIVFLRALPAGWRQPVLNVSRFWFVQKFESVITSPLAAWLISAAALWIWHVPWLFDRAVKIDWIHAAQHSTFFASALLFWWPLIGKKPALGYGAGVLYVFTTALHTSILGALLTFATRAWYRPYVTTAPAWNLTALQDQQLGGLIMWIPAGTLLLVVGLILFVRWLNESQTRWQYKQMAGLARSSKGVAP